MTPLFKVTCYSLSEDLINVEVDKRFPLAFPDASYLDEVKAKLAEVDPTEVREYRNNLWHLAQDIQAKTSQELCTREEMFGMFLSFEKAERYVIEGANDWDECGYYNIARIAQYREGLIYAQLPAQTWWYRILDGQTRGYDQPPLKVEKIDPPLRFKNYYWYQEKSSKG